MLPISVLAVPCALGFTSLPPGTSPHDEVTLAAAQEADYPRDGRPALLEAVRAPDLEEMEWDPSAESFVAVGFQDAYRPEHHCDRQLPDDDASSLRRTVDHIAKERRAAAASIAAGNASDAVRALGRALHAVQDCFSHTSAAEEGPDRLGALEAALLDGAPLPAGLRVTAVSPHAEPPGEPEDPYGHDGHAKDSPHHNEVAKAQSGSGGQTHYEQAHEAATNASARVLEEFLVGLDEDQRRAIAAVDITHESDYLKAVNGRTVVAAVVLLGIVAALGYAGQRWWRGRRSHP